MKKQPLVVLTGPTAVGKTKLSIELAKAINGEIISADSMQVYKGMDIGSAKIMPSQMQGVPHHLIDVLEPMEDFNVVIFQRKCKECMQEIYERGHIPILTGGTGFYIQAVEPEGPADQAGVRGGDVIIAVLAITLTVCCFNVLADLIGFPREDVRQVINTFTYYFWPALIAGGFLSGVTKKVRTALKCLLVWLLILVLFCFVPGNVTVPEAEDVAVMEITYAYDMYEHGGKVSYKYKGHSFKDPAIIAEVVEMLDDSKYTYTHNKRRFTKFQSAFSYSS